MMNDILLYMKSREVEVEEVNSVTLININIVLNINNICIQPR